MKWNNNILIQLNWGLVHSIILRTKCCAPAIVMHWQLTHTCQSSLCCLLLVHNALLVCVCFGGMGFLHSTPCCSFSVSNHVVVYTHVLHHTILHAALRPGPEGEAEKDQKEIVHRNYCRWLCWYASVTLTNVNLLHLGMHYSTYIAVYWCTSVAEVTRKTHMRIPSTTLT